MISGKALTERIEGLAPAERRELMAALAPAEALKLDADWPVWVHAGQEPPTGADWRVWVMMAGRGFGKTRAGAEWVSGLARAHPGAAIALVAATADEARKIMVEGRSGLLGVASPWERAKMKWAPSRGRLVFASGAEAMLYSGAQAEGLRGPEHHFAWCDELAKWRQAQAAWDNLMLGLRLAVPNGSGRPRALVTTTPRPIALLRAIIADAETAQTGGTTRANPHVSGAFVASMERRHGGTHFGRQELGGELIGEAEGALWPRALIEGTRHRGSLREFRRVVIGVDPPAGSTGDACGIVAVGLGADGVGYVLGDHSVSGLSPEGWAKKVAVAAEVHGAARVVAEANNGGRMVESVLRGAGLELPVRLVQASERKVARAAPVAALFESGRARFAGAFPALEDELAGLGWDGRYQGPGRSPDRADAMVWAFTDLMLGPAAGAPRVRSL